MTTTDTHERFIELRANNISYEKIAKELGVSKVTLMTWAKTYQHDIANCRSYRLNALQEQYKVGKEHRIKMLGDRLERLLKEAESRDLSEIPTYKLFELIDRTSLALEREETPFTVTEVNDSFSFLDTETITTFTA